MRSIAIYNIDGERFVFRNLSEEELDMLELLCDQSGYLYDIDPEDT